MRRFFSQLLLILGGLAIVVSAYLTLRCLSDRTALTLTVPGFVAGLALIGVSLQLGRRGAGLGAAVDGDVRKEVKHGNPE